MQEEVPEQPWYRQQVIPLPNQDDRKLKESITVVRNATELLDAVRHHTRHIELQQHFDVTGLSIPSSREHILGNFLPTGIESIRVRFSASTRDLFRSLLYSLSELPILLL